MSENTKAKKKGLSTNQKIAIVGFSVILVVLVVIGVLIYQKLSTQQEPAPVTTNGNLVLDESNLGDIDDILTETVADGMFEVNMNTSWSFSDGKSASSDAYVANGLANRYPITFEILLNGEENIYTSTLIPVGKQIKDIILEKDLEPGSYDAVCMYHLWDEDGEENSSLGVNVRITVAS